MSKLSQYIIGDDNLDKDEYSTLVKKKSKNPFIFKNVVISFLIGGTLGSIYEIITSLLISLFKIENTFASGITCVVFIFAAVILTGFGVFDTLISKFKFGLIIPITGFAHSVASSLIDYKNDGLVTGLGSNMFKLAGSVILYGTISAFVLTLLKVIIYG